MIVALTSSIRNGSVNPATDIVSQFSKTYKVLNNIYIQLGGGSEK